MAAHPKDDGRPATGHEGGADAKRNDQRAVAREGPAIAGEAGAAENDGQDPEKNAGDHAQKGDQPGEPRVTLGVANRAGYLLRRRASSTGKSGREPPPWRLPIEEAPPWQLPPPTRSAWATP